ncbi:AcrR family transcriptional regulator [Nonomuraea thailandensis]|uniref:AcrR family transcriptional regulator n=1 Tax=Nonomuraea thailandensis TaxID=1188745 RepID=A0A9X2GLW3_9ACTN|nr:TetR/AcrR family transcriptional regulator [Nonomuraea thailandensis]MCP2360004.1 AcrR family transcriptional regulator [Nonomuraea thailandensis]
MSTEPVRVEGFRQPQQARSREALQRILTAAEEVLHAGGFDDFTMAAVAERAGVSIGAIYRRFDGREQLLAALKDRLLSGMERRVGEGLAGADPSLGGVMDAYVHALADALSLGGRTLADLLRVQNIELADRGVQAHTEMRRLVREAAAPYMTEVRRADPAAAVDTAVRTVTASCIFTAVQADGSEENVIWADHADQLSDMAVAYLLTPDRRKRADKSAR